MPANSVSNKIANSSAGIITSLTELTLYWIFFSLEVNAAGHKTAKIYQAAERAQLDVDEISMLFKTKLNLRTFQNKLYYLKRRGLIQTTKRSNKEFQLTPNGRKIILDNTPTYQSTRPWDGKVYLVTYDIAEQQKALRDSLREYLKRIGCALLQASVYISVYDPRAILHAWSLENKVTNSIIVSDLGQDGHIAGKNIPELINDLYDLEATNNHYVDFITKYQENPSVNQFQLQKDWMVCIDQDPQLPFDLLPPKFTGPTAYKLYKQLSNIKPTPLTRKKVANQNTIWKQNEHRYLRKIWCNRHNFDLDQTHFIICTRGREYI